VLVHRDYHPGNVLWRRGTVSGVVDWQAICTGPGVIDVAHCRVNLLTFGTGTARQFTTWWQRVSGTAYHPWADVITIIGFLDDLREDWGSEQFLVEDMLGRAVAELGGSTRLLGTSLTPDGHGDAEKLGGHCWRSSSQGLRTLRPADLRATRATRAISLPKLNLARRGSRSGQHFYRTGPGQVIAAERTD
jgi:Phosphotransferase enzyme family